MVLKTVGSASNSKDSADRSAKLLKEQVKLVFVQAPVSMAGTAVNSLILMAILWPVSSPWRLLIWLGLSLSVLWLRYRPVRRFKQGLVKDDEITVQVRPFIIGLLVSGVLLGSTGIFLFPVHSFPHQVFLIFLLGGMVAGAAGVYSVMMEAYLAFSIPTLSPVIIRLFAQGNKIEIAMGAMVLLFFVIMLTTAYHVHRTTLESLRLRFENADLIDHLKLSKESAEEAVETLRREISERKSVEKALQESERLFRMLVETMNDGLVFQDENGCFTYLNDTFCKMSGYLRDELIGRRIQDFLDEEGRAKYEREIEPKSLRTQISYEVEILTKTGEKLPAIISAAPVFDQRGEFKGTIAVITDISVLKKAQKDLIESEEKYRTIFENSPLGIVHFDKNGRITAYNTALARMSGSSKEEFVGLSPLEYLEDDELKSAIAACLSGVPGHYEGYYRSRRTSQTTPIKAVFSPIFSEDSEFIGGIGIIQDISEQKKAEEELSQQLHFLQTLIDTIPNIIFYKDCHGVFVGCNRAFESRLGRKKHEIIGKTVYDMLPRKLAEQYHAMDLELFQNPGEQLFETSLFFADGTRHDLLLSKATYTNADGVLAGLVGVGLDITEQKRAEKALRKAHGELEKRVQERTFELAKAVEELQQEIVEREKAEQALVASSEKLKLFAYSVVHDLKSPAIGIYGVAKLLQKHYGAALDERAKNYCDQILKASEHVAALVEQVNVFISSKEAPLEFEDVNVTDILRMVKDEFSTILNLRRVKWEEPLHAIHIRGDRLGMHRIFRNLIDNSLKYGGEGLSRIRIDYWADEQFHFFSITDDGVGVAKEGTEKIFGAFKRDKTARGVAGTGLGLAIVKEIAERHGGEVWCEPERPKGTTFYVSIARKLQNRQHEERT